MRMELIQPFINAADAVFAESLQGPTKIIDVEMDENAYRRFVKDHNVNVLTVRDPSGKSNGLFGTFKYPETYIIDRNGVMRRKFIGAVDWTEPEITDFLNKL